MRTSSAESFASTSSLTLNQNLNFVLKPAELKQFEIFKK